MWGEERLTEVVRSYGRRPVSELVRAVKTTVDDFGAEARRGTDDLTLVALGIGRPGRTSTDGPLLERRMIVPRESRRLVDFRALIDDVAASSGAEVTAEDIMELKRAGQEAVTNAIRHSRPLDPASPLDVRLSVWPGRIVLEVRFDGVAFQPTSISLPDVSSFPEGGFGLFIIQESVDEVERGLAADGRNYIRLTKNLT